MEGGKVKPANDAWDRDEVDGDLRYKETDPVSNVSIFGRCIGFASVARVYG